MEKMEIAHHEISKIDKKMVRMWIRMEEKIRKQKPHSEASGRGCQALFPSIEQKLYEEFKTMRKDGKIVNQWWFNNRVKQLLKEQNPSKADDFKASDRWFSAFCRRYSVSLGRETHTSQKAPEQLRPAITKFHAKLLRKKTRGKYADCDNKERGENSKAKYTSRDKLSTNFRTFVTSSSEGNPDTVKESSPRTTGGKDCLHLL